MISQKYKTRAMMENSLRDHHRNLFIGSLCQGALIFLIASILVCAVL